MDSQFAFVPAIQDGVVFSDPLYGADVWCQYRKDFTDQLWLMRLDSFEDDGIVYFNMYLGRPTFAGNVEISESESGSAKVFYPSRYEIQDVELGIDSAQIFCGSKKNWDRTRTEAAIHTGADGLFGNLMVFTCKGEQDPAGFVLMGAIDGCFMDAQSLHRHFTASFDGQSISRETFEARTDPASLFNRALAAQETFHANHAVSREPTAPEKKPPQR